MTSTKQHQISILQIVQRVALGLGVALAPTIFATPSAQAQTHNVLYSFAGGTDGATPNAGLVLDDAGNLYGTTKTGGVSNLGTIFKLDTDGNETLLHSFTGGADGATPNAGLILDPAGNLYGTTYEGGASNFGTVFKLDTAGTETVLLSFTGGADGASPYAGLVLDGAGNLYGTTAGGGASNSGTVFKLDAAGTQTVLYSFTGGADGRFPYAGLVLDAAGNVYGTTSEGGVNGAPCLADYFLGCGMVFKLGSTGTETVLYTFTGGADGRNPLAGLVLDASGNLYGTGVAGGPSDQGVVFKLDTAGNETVLYGFTASNDGHYPESTLIFDHADNLYGTTTSGGASGFGTMFELDTTGKETLLYSFTGGADGATPYAGLTLDDNTGILYGTTSAGGASNFGTVFEITPDFSLSVSGFTPNPVKAGASSTSAMNINALSAFNSTVALSCSVKPSSGSAPKCSINPSSITVGTPATLTVTTTRTSASGLPPRSGSALFYALSLPLIGVVAGVGSGSNRKRKRKGWVLACLLFAGLVFGVACGGGSTSSGGGSGGGTTYTITVTGASGSSSHSITTTLTVQ